MSGTIGLTAETPRASTVHHKVGHTDQGLWRKPSRQLPAYIQNVAKHLIPTHGESKGIQMAVGIVKNWAAGHDGHGHKVHPDVQAAAARNIAEWEALKASTKHGTRLARTGAAVELAIATATTSKSVPADTVYRLLARNYPSKVLGWVKSATWSYRSAVPLSLIDMARRPGGRDPGKVLGIAKAMAAGQKMEPIVLVETPEGLEIADGYHRTLAYKHTGKATIPAFVATGAGNHGPWESTMHDAKLNLSEEVRMSTVDLANMAGQVMPDEAAVRKMAAKISKLPPALRPRMRSMVLARAKALGVKVDLSARRTSVDLAQSMDEPMKMTVNTTVSNPAALNKASRAKLADQGKALPGGRFPIRSKTDLGKAIRAVGRAKTAHASIRVYIMRRAEALGAKEMIPDNWGTDGTLKVAS